MNFYQKYESFNKSILLLFGLFPILPNSIKGLPVIMLLLSGLIDYFINTRKKDRLHKRKTHLFIVMSSLYFFYLMTYFYSENTNYFGKKLEIGLSLITIPLSFYLINSILTKSALLFFKKAYVFGVSFFSIIFLSHVFIYKNDRYPKGVFDVNFIRSSINELPIINTHPIYASIFFGIGILFLLSLFKKIKRPVFIPIFILLTLSISILSSKMVIISLLIIIMIYLFVSITNIKYRLLSISLVLLISFLSIIYVPNLNYRFNELFKSTTYQNIDKYNSTSIRNEINLCSFELLKKSWQFGYGIGDVQDELNNCYALKSDILLQKQYNTHNQYLSIWLGTGILGLISFLYMLFFNFKLAIKHNDILFLSILIFFSINLLTENLLERQSGVILFAFLINFLGFYHIKKLDNL